MVGDATFAVASMFEFADQFNFSTQGFRRIQFSFVFEAGVSTDVLFVESVLWFSLSLDLCFETP